MPVVKEQELPVRTEENVVQVRQMVRKCAEELRFSLIDQTKLVTAASELARNTIIHGGGGKMRLSVLTHGIRNGIQLIFEDEGPGIANVEMALRDGYTTGGGLGLGLGGSKRLVNEFTIDSAPGKGTRITATRWK